MDGLTDTPGSVLPCRYRRGSSGHPSTDAVADALQRPTRALGRAALKRALSGLAPGGVYLAFPVTREAGGLLHHRFTLTCASGLRTRPTRRSVLCGTGLRVTPSGRYPPPCSAEPGRSSSHLRDARPPGQPIRVHSTGSRSTGCTADPRPAHRHLWRPPQRPLRSYGADSAPPFRRQDPRRPRIRRPLALPELPRTEYPPGGSPGGAGYCERA